MITWNEFILKNPDNTTAFENMCRLLFMHMYINNSYFHSNPNNPGIEIEPLKDISGTYSSFQCKFFSNKINYDNIFDSINKCVTYYSGQINNIYLYCNKDLSTKCANYKKSEMLCSEHNIKLIPITNKTILDSVMEDSIVKSCFFGEKTFNSNWFEEKFDYAKKSLGKRYNTSFNVPTEAKNQLDLFCNNKESISYLNNRIKQSIKELSNFTCSDCKIIGNNLISKINKFLDDKFDFNQFIKFHNELNILCSQETEIIKGLTSNLVT